MQWVLLFLGLCCYWNGCSDKVLSLPSAPKPKYQGADDRLYYVLQGPVQSGDILWLPQRLILTVLIRLLTIVGRLRVNAFMQR